MKQILCDHLQTIGKQIRLAESRYQLNTPVSLLAVSKRHPVKVIQQAWECGQTLFGENYAQEMRDKAEQLATLHDSNIEWHFIGPIQSNKTRIIAETAHWVHSIDRLKVAQRLSDQKPDSSPPINICLQINVNKEASKSGILLDELADLAKDIEALEGITLRGLMAIPEPTVSFEKQRINFAKVRKAMERLNKQGYNLDTLSMGMSGDMEAAIAEGATIVRIGTAIFGQRP